MGEARKSLEQPLFGLHRMARLERHKPGAIFTNPLQANPIKQLLKEIRALRVHASNAAQRL